MSSRASRRCGGKNSLISHRTKKETPRLSAGGSLSVRQPVHIIPTGLLARVANPRFAVLILEPRTSPAVRAGPCDHTRCARFHVVPLSSCCLPYKNYSTLPCTSCQIDPRPSVRVKIGLSRNAKKKYPPPFGGGHFPVRRGTHRLRLGREARLQPLPAAMLHRHPRRIPSPRRNESRRRRESDRRCM